MHIGFAATKCLACHMHACLAQVSELLKNLTALDAGNGLRLTKAEAVQIARYQVRVLETWQAGSFAGLSGPTCTRN